MALVKKKGTYHLAIRLDGRQVWASSGTTNKARARNIERQVPVACRSKDFRCLDPESRAVCIQLFENQGWTVQADIKNGMSFDAVMGKYAISSAKLSEFLHQLVHIGLLKTENLPKQPM